MTMTVEKVIKFYLSQHGFQGLVNSDAGCGCEQLDLAPCGNVSLECSAGYKHFDPAGDQKYDWIISTDKNPPETFSDAP